MKNKKGFTLIEVLVVVAIVSILVVLGVVAYRNYQRKTDLDVTAQHIINTLRRAQNQSITAKIASQYGVHFDAAAGSYTLFEGDSWAGRNPDTLEVFEIPKSLEMYDINFAETGIDVVFRKLTGTTPNFGSLKIRVIVNPSQFKVISVNSEGKIGEYELTEEIPPTSFSLLTPPKGHEETATLLPSFDWEDSLGSGITYTLWHSTDPDFSTKTEITSILNSEYTLHPGEELVNHTRNYWKVKAINDAGIETWSREQDWYVDVNVSNPPNDFSLLSPADGYNETVTLTPTFDWEDTEDPDGDPLTYTFQHSTNTSFNPKTEITLISESKYTLKAAEKLANHTTNYWRVYAVDIHGASKLCREGYWSINTDVNFAPNNFSLGSPTNGEIVTTSTPTFDWEDATDPDPGDTVTYTIWYSTDPTFTSKTEATGLTSSEYTVPSSSPLTYGQTYYWKVKAVDSHGAETWSNQQDWSFYVDQAPTNFSLLSPANGEIIHTLTPLFDWQDSVDPDPGDTVTYTIWVDDDPDFSSLLFERSGLTESEYQAQVADGLQDDTTYYWKVKAVDNHGAETWSNETDWSFSIALQVCDWHVDASVSSSGDGLSWPTAFKTINEAVSVLSGGDTVCIANGTYTEQINLTSSHSGTDLDHTVFVAKIGDTNVIVDGPNTSYVFLFNGADYVDIDGLKIISARYGVQFYNGADHNTIKNSEINDHTYYGVYIHSTNNGNNEIDTVNIYNNGRYGVYGYGNQNIIYNSAIHDNTYHGLYLYWPDNYRIYNNVIYSNGRHGLYIYRGNVEIYNNEIRNNSQRGLYFYRTSNTIVRNNQVNDNVRGGIYIRQGISNRVYKSTIYGNGGYGIYVYGGRSDVYDNQVNNNSYDGIYLAYPSANSQIYENTVYSSQRGVRTYRGNRVSIYNNEIYNNLREGIYTSRPTRYQIYDNLIYSNGRQGLIHYFGNRMTIHHNKIYGNSREGILLYAGSNVSVYRNQAYDNIRAGLYVFWPDRFHVYNNTLDGNREGIFIFWSVRPIRLRNNIMTSNNCGFRVIWGSANINNDYNDVWGNVNNYCNQGSAYQGANSISEDPLFVDPGANDFHLRSGSPCIDRGDPNPFYNDPDGTRADIGALWYGAP